MWRAVVLLYTVYMDVWFVINILKVIFNASIIITDNIYILLFNKQKSSSQGGLGKFHNKIGSLSVNLTFPFQECT